MATRKPATITVTCRAPGSLLLSDLSALNSVPSVLNLFSSPIPKAKTARSKPCRSLNPVICYLFAAICYRSSSHLVPSQILIIQSLKIIPQLLIRAPLRQRRSHL